MDTVMMIVAIAMIASVPIMIIGTTIAVLFSSKKANN